MKESKNLGIRKSCPKCKKTVIVDANLIGIKGTFGIKCPHCSLKKIDTVVTFEVNNKTILTIVKSESKPSIIISIVVLFIIVTGFYFVKKVNDIDDSIQALHNKVDIINTWDDLMIDK